MLTTDQTRAFYDRYSYPFPEIKEAYDLNGAGFYSILDLELRARGFEGRRFLDAGCGSGHRILQIAKAFPKATFRAFDLSERSIRLAQAQATADDVRNITFEVGDITTYSTEECYDIIGCNGVLHHLDNPVAALRNLARLMTPQGFMTCWVFHTYGEFDRMLQRSLLHLLLGEDSGDFEAAVGLMREMGLEVSATRYGKSYGEELSDADRLTKDADAFLSPQVMTFTFGQAIALCRDAGLRWASIEQINWDGQGQFLSLETLARRPFWVLEMETFFARGSADFRFRSLIKTDRLRALELTLRPTGFTFIAGRDGAQALDSNRIRGNSIPTGAAPDVA